MEILLPDEYNSLEDVFSLWKFFRKSTIACLEKTPKEIFTVNPDPTRWSISEVGEHLYITQNSLARTFPIVMAKKFGEDFQGYKEPIHFKLVRRSMMKPTKVKNPASVTPLNKYSLEELLPLLNSAEEKMSSFVSKFKKENLETRAMEHPIFGMLNLFHYFWVMTMHERSHLTALEDRTKEFS
jgi:hypothetical protein